MTVHLRRKSKEHWKHSWHQMIIWTFSNSSYIRLSAYYFSCPISNLKFSTNEFNTWYLKMTQTTLFQSETEILILWPPDGYSDQTVSPQTPPHFCLHVCGSLFLACLKFPGSMPNYPSTYPSISTPSPASLWRCPWKFFTSHLWNTIFGIYSEVQY